MGFTPLCNFFNLLLFIGESLKLFSLDKSFPRPDLNKA